MPDDSIDQKLRAMAEHRGLKLIKSRRRKPGTGDFGKFGLTDASGKPLLGVSEAGLTASAAEVEAYLRKGAESSWKTSVKDAPGRVSPARKSEKKAEDDAGEASAIRPCSTKSVARKRTIEEEGDSEKGRRPASEAELKAKPANPPPPPPKLHLRVARPTDAAGLATLLRQLNAVAIDEAGVSRNLQAVFKAKGGIMVAEQGELVGCCCWAIIPTIQHGGVGRITMLLVDQNHRRRGIATALVEAVSASLHKAGCTRMEAMSDIDVRNGHAFFRALTFEQTSYRFARIIEADG